MTDLYIKTPTQADYDALMRLAEAAGYEWYSKHKPTNLNCYTNHSERSVVKLSDDRKLLIGSVECFEREGRVIETIPNLAKIKSIWNVKLDDWGFYTIGRNVSPVHYPKNGEAVVEGMDGRATWSNDLEYKTLAVEYKPQESEVMPEKVKLPKFMCTWLTQFDSKFPLSNIAKINEKRLKDSTGHEIYHWLNSNETNQWKLIDALRYGYEPEPEQLYYVMFVKRDHNRPSRFFNKNMENGELFIDDVFETANVKTKFTMPEIEAIDPRYKAFAVPVEEVDGNA